MKVLDKIKNNWNLNRCAGVRISRSVQSKLRTFLFIFSISFLIVNWVSKDTVTESFVEVDECLAINQAPQAIAQLELNNEIEVELETISVINEGTASYLFPFTFAPNVDKDCTKAYLHSNSTMLEKERIFSPCNYINVKDLVSSFILTNNYHYLKKVGSLIEEGSCFDSLSKITFCWVRARAPGNYYVDNAS